MYLREYPNFRAQIRTRDVQGMETENSPLNVQNSAKFVIVQNKSWALLSF